MVNKKCRGSLVFVIILLFVGTSLNTLVVSKSSEINHKILDEMFYLDVNNEIIIYVNNSNIKEGPDGSYENPFRNITSALEKAFIDDNPNIVFVFCGNGTYNESVILSKPVNLIGEHKIGSYSHNPILLTDEDATYGIRIETDRAKVEGFRIIGNKKECKGIILDAHSWRNTISYNVIENCEFGIELGNRTIWNDVSFNLIQNCRSGGIFTDAFHWSGGNTIVNNLIRNIDTEAAIHISKSSSNYIGGNFIKDCCRGVEVYTSLSTSRFNIIASNVFDKCSDYDVIFWDGGYGNIVFGNDFLDNSDPRKATFTNTFLTFWLRNYWGKSNSQLQYTIQGSNFGISIKQLDVRSSQNQTVTDYIDFVWPPFK
jgi:hypothetical protein